jgi:hypothetical protein
MKPLIFCVTLLIAVHTALAAGPAKRARPPQFSKEVTDAFFPNALEKLVGPRPQRKAAPPATPPVAEKPLDTRAHSGDAARWPALIDAETLEDEIKSQHRVLGLDVQSALKFKGGQYQDARLRLPLLAAMFAITSDYGEPVRWQREASAMRDQLAQAAANCKVGTDASYTEAKARYEDLRTLLEGSSPKVGEADVEAEWAKVADLTELMKRMEEAGQNRITPWTGSEGEFKSNQDKILHEAQLLSVMARVIGHSSYEYASDEAYVKHAKALEEACREIVDGAKQTNFDKTRAAAGNMAKACANCHSDFR